MPLSIVGHFLNQVGSHLLEFASKIENKRVRKRQIFKPKHKVISIHLLPNGEILTHALKTEFKVEPDSSGQFKVVDGP